MNPEVDQSKVKNQVGMTMDQFFAWAEGQSCCNCEKKATYFPADTGLCYCDSCFDLILGSDNIVASFEIDKHRRENG